MHEFGAKQDPPHKKAGWLNPALSRATGPHQIPVLQQPSSAASRSKTGPGFAFGQVPVYAARDATYVKAQTGEEFLQRLHVLNKQAEDEFLAQRLAVQGTLKPGGAEVKKREDMAAQQVLKDQFGAGWGAFFWIMRGGGQTGEGSRLWNILGALGSLNRSYPPPPYDTAPSIHPAQLPKTYSTESKR